MTVLKQIISSVRPGQWIKNTFVFAALIFAREFMRPDAFAIVFAAFILFCAAGSAVYLVNDIVDLPGDRLHPTKRLRPIASGALGVSLAGAIAVCLATLALIGGFWLSISFGWMIALYIALNVLYSFFLKQLVIIDVICIALGFVIRVVAGAVVIAVPFSSWLIFCTFFLTLFLALSKRKAELSAGRAAARGVLAEYSVPFLDQMTMIVLPMTLITYTFYTFSSEHTKLLMLTVPVVLYGIFRYLYIMKNKFGYDNGPTDDLLGDPGLIATVAVWVVLVMILLLFWQ